MTDDDQCMAVGLSQFKRNSSPIKENMQVCTEVADCCISAELCKDFGDFEDENDPFDIFHIPENEKEGFQYTLGYITHRFSGKYPYLESMEKDVLYDWISVKNYNGGLKRMASSYIEKFTVIEQVFRQCHGDSLIDTGPGIAVMSQIAMKTISHLPEEVIKFYFKCRLHFRLKHLNKNVRADKLRSKFKKMAKLTV